MGKLYPIRPSQFEKFLLFIGCTFSRQKGSHKAYRRTGLIRPIIVPFHTGDLPLIVIKNTLKQLNMTTEQYLEIMSRL
jgi:predicted RNA binding protein YcfA (HicA-like mRNA interferase family)